MTCALLTAALPHVPIVHWAWWPLNLLSTLAHELGHGVAALLVGGHFDHLVVYADGSGVAVTATSGGRIARAVVAAGGLVGPAVAAAGMFLLARTQRHARVALAVTAGLLLLVLLLVVRNLFGIASCSSSPRLCRRSSTAARAGYRASPSCSSRSSWL